MAAFSYFSGMRPSVRKRPTVTDAVSCARQFGYPWMVCEMDHEDGRKQYVRPLRYADDAEFEAFDGEVISIGYPDGSTEFAS